MIMIPRHHPILEGLNSHYLRMERFLKHYQGEIGSGCVYLKSSQIEGAIFFDSDQLLSANLQTSHNSASGKQAVSVLMEQVEKHNFSVSVFQIGPDVLPFWANLSQAQPIYRNLTTDLTDLNRLIAKMQSQDFTGMIEAIIGERPESGFLFFSDGRIVGGSPPAGDAPMTVAEIQQYLIDQTTAKGGTFNVSQLATYTPSTAEKSLKPIHPSSSTSSKDLPKVFNPIPMAQELLNLLESVCREGRRIKDFQTPFRKALVESSEKFAFLDPFLKEFEYIDGKIRLEDHVDPKMFVSGVLACVRRMLVEQNLTEQFEAKSRHWFKSNHAILKAFGLPQGL